MISSAFFAFLHFVAVFGIVGALFLEWKGLPPSVSERECRWIM
jgi:hypothetical protein